MRRRVALCPAVSGLPGITRDYQGFGQTEQLSAQVEDAFLATQASREIT
jgi:hypothetical protein